MLVMITVTYVLLMTLQDICIFFFCLDVDECRLDVAGCSSSADCINTVGSFSCKCRSGFTGDGFTCKKGINSFALQSVFSV